MKTLVIVLLALSVLGCSDRKVFLYEGEAYLDNAGTSLQVHNPKTGEHQHINITDIGEIMMNGKKVGVWEPGKKAKFTISSSGWEYKGLIESDLQ